MCAGLGCVCDRRLENNSIYVCHNLLPQQHQQQSYGIHADRMTAGVAANALRATGQAHIYFTYSYRVELQQLVIQMCLSMHAVVVGDSSR